MNFFTWNDMWSIFSRLIRSTLGRHVVGRIPHLRPSVDFYILSIFLLPKGAQGTYITLHLFPVKFIYSENATEIWRNLQKRFTLLSISNNTLRFHQIVVTISKYMNFIIPLCQGFFLQAQWGEGFLEISFELQIIFKWKDLLSEITLGMNVKVV